MYEISKVNFFPQTDRSKTFNSEGMKKAENFQYISRIPKYIQQLFLEKSSPLQVILFVLCVMNTYIHLQIHVNDTIQVFI
jgi:hypothetical protein